MNILILGASSVIGQSLVKEFSKNNKLYLLSRNADQLESLKKESIALGSTEVNLIQGDLSLISQVVNLIDNNIELIINNACATSQLKDEAIDPIKYSYLTHVDLIEPLFLLENILKRNPKDRVLKYIFINTVLSKIRSPNYSIYCSYKNLQQEYLRGFESKYPQRVKIMNVIIGANINRKKENEKSIALAKNIKSAYFDNKSEFIFGFEGKIIYKIYRISPLLSDFIIYLKRLLKN